MQFKNCTKILEFITINQKKVQTNVGDGKSKIGPLSHFKGWVKRPKKKFNKVAGVKYTQKKNCCRKKKSQKMQDFNRND